MTYAWIYPSARDRDYRGTLERIAIQSPCDYCGAEARMWCRTESGNVPLDLHRARMEAVENAWSLGYDMGLLDAEHKAVGGGQQ